MKVFRFPGLFLLFIGIAPFALSIPAVYSQEQDEPPQRANARNVLGDLSTAFSVGKTIQNVRISGYASWYAGSLEDSGTVTLTASADGSSQMQLLLGGSGKRTETQAGVGSNATCSWAGADGITHEVRSGSCWRPVLWFLPALSLQTSSLSGSLRVVDLGMGTVGGSTNIHRHLQSQITLSDVPDALATDVMQQSKTEIGLDPISHLPTTLTYSVRPDSGAQVAIAIEVHYSDYRTVDGVQIPFLIQRYVNGSLQLEIHINSAEIN